MNRAELASELAVAAETAAALGETPWAELMREASTFIKNDGLRIHDLNERLLETNREVTDLTWRLERLRP
jgi:hypothetical protein